MPLSTATRRAFKKRLAALIFQDSAIRTLASDAGLPRERLPPNLAPEYLWDTILGEVELQPRWVRQAFLDELRELAPILDEEPLFDQVRKEWLSSIAPREEPSPPRHGLKELVSKVKTAALSTRKQPPETFPLTEPKRPKAPSPEPGQPLGSSNRWTWIVLPLALLALLLAWWLYAVIRPNEKPDPRAHVVQTTYQLPGGNVGITWRTLPAGAFTMGSETGDRKAQPIHTVSLNAFSLLESEVTVAQYRACVEAGQCTAPNEGDTCSWNVPGLELHPVNCVDWYQAEAYAKWLSTVIGGKVRLPTETEWEYAARGPEGRRYPWGDTPPPSCTLAILNSTTPPGSDPEGCGSKHTWPVCSRPPGNTPEGMCDLAGNVREWVEDCWQDDYSHLIPAGAPPRSTCPDGKQRAVRGGSWLTHEEWADASTRLGLQAELRYADVGFRLVRIPPDQAR